MAAPPINWNTDSASVLISIGTRSLYLTVLGPSRKLNQPIVIVEAGMGDNSKSWRAVQTLVSKSARIFTYDWAGYGRSDPGPDPRTAIAVAQDLSALLDAAKVTGPFVLVCHSYGGLLAREFVALRRSDVVGMVLVEANQEKTFGEMMRSMEPLMAALGELDYYEVTGLNAENGLEEEDWKVAKEEGLKNQRGSEQEIKVGDVTARELAEKGQFEKQVLGNCPVVVIKGNLSRDYRKIYDAGTKAGNGSTEQREFLRQFIETMDPIDERLQREQLQLSSNSRFVHAEKSGHNIHLTEPELIAAEIRRVLDLSGLNA